MMNFKYQVTKIISLNLLKNISSKVHQKFIKHLFKQFYRKTVKNVSESIVYLSLLDANDIYKYILDDVEEALEILHIDKLLK